MHFVVDANLPLSCVGLLQSFGHTALHVREVGLAGSRDAEIACYARTASAVLLTRDLDFADIRAYPVADYHGLVVFRLPETATAREILSVLEQLLKSERLVESLPQHLAILEHGRVRFRPPLHD